MPSNRETLQIAHISASRLARVAGVRRTAVADYLARRWRKCGRENRRKIYQALQQLGVVAKPDPKALLRRKLKAFHSDANSVALYRELTHQPVLAHLPGDQFYTRRFSEVI